MSKSEYEILKEEAVKAMKSGSTAGDNQIKSAPYIAFGRADMAAELGVINREHYKEICEIINGTPTSQRRFA